MYKKEIIIFGSDNSNICLDLKDYLDNKQVPFTYYNIDKDMDPKELLYLTGSEKIPVIYINGKKQIGFDNELGVVLT